MALSQDVIDVDNSTQSITTQVWLIQISANITLTSITLSCWDEQKRYSLMSASWLFFKLLFESVKDGKFTKSASEILWKLSETKASRQTIRNSINKTLGEFWLTIVDGEIIYMNQTPNIKNQVKQNAMDLLSVSKYVDDIKIEYHSDKELLIIDWFTIKMQTMQLNVFLYFLADYLWEDYWDSTILDKSGLRVHITNINKILTNTGLAIKPFKTTTSSSYKIKNQKANNLSIWNTPIWK